MNFLKLRDKLRSLPNDLPGEEAQLLMAPLARGRFPKDAVTISQATKSAVLVLIYPKDDFAHTVLIKRNEYPGVHSGQVSFPGGRFESSDRDASHTALREAEEEIGIPSSEVEMFGSLTHLYIPPSRFLVYPFLGLLSKQPQFKPDPREVAAIIELDLSLLLEERNVKSKTMSLSSGMETEVPYFDFHGHEVWGATAMILSELKELIRPGSVAN